jgi:hypothetical protein
MVGRLVPLCSLLLLQRAGLCRASECCSDLLLDDKSDAGSLHPVQGNRLGFYSRLGEFGARPAYRSAGTCIFKLSSVSGS